MTGTYRNPRLILRHSAAQNNDAFEIVTVANTDQMRDYKARYVGRFVEVTGPDSLADVPVNILLAVFNKTRGDKPLDRFRDRQTAERRAFEVISGLATPYEVQIQENTVSTESTAAKGGKRKNKKAAEAAAEGGEQTAVASETPAPKPVGVIGTVKELLSRPEGASIDEIVEVCKVRFPDRPEDGMRSTAKIQSSRLAKSEGVAINAYLVKGRGRVYRFANVELPSELEIEVPAEKPAKLTKAQKEVQAEAAPAEEVATA
jgi:hypothetical protein